MQNNTMEEHPIRSSGTAFNNLLTAPLGKHLCRTLIASLIMLATACQNSGSADTGSTTLSDKGPVIDAPAGQLEGLAEGKLQVFKGIPYAVPPVGPARWTPPVALPRWLGVKNATQFGSPCSQLTNRPKNIYTEEYGEVSEDCLTLNVWAPADASNAPVFVWFHGGSLVSGSSMLPFYNGSRLAEQGIVVVSANFRVGIFGYLAHPELSAESPLDISGHYGILDQVEVLSWIQKNISSFGGNPENVTIAGESSGALGVMYLMATPKARGLFAKAIAQSAYMISSPELKQSNLGLASAESDGLTFANAINKPNLAALREMDTQSLIDAAAKTGYFTQATIDGHILPRQLVDTFNRGEQAPVPIMAGFNSGEIRSLRFLAPPPPASQDAYETIIRERYLDLTDEFLRLYPSDDMQESILATTRDALYGWTAERLVKQQTELGLASYLYYYDHSYPAADEMGLHAFHASELPYVFGTTEQTPPLWPKIPDTPVEARFTDAMVGYWSSFVRSGKPTAANEPDWPAYGTAKEYMYLGETPKPSKQLFPGMYELHEQAVCRRWASGQSPWHWNAGIVSPVLTAIPGDRCL